jgi:beta-phosphoglucomutase-like phosphatase (HAD superfamily)
MIAGYIFDMDGTLVDTEVLWVEATAIFLRERGFEITNDEATALVYGRSWTDVYDSLRNRYPTMTVPRPDMEVIMTGLMRSLRAQRDVRITGSIQLLRRLAVTHPVCIVSGSPRADIDDAIALMGIDDCLAFSLAAEDYHPGKPDPSCFLMAATHLNLPPSQCLVFEDSHAGVCAAKRAGMWCVALTRDGAPVQDVSNADLQLCDLADFRPEALPGNAG